MAKPGDVVDGRYTVVQAIGRGATADIFEATDAGGGAVALKILRASLARDATARARFDREVAVQERIRHTNVARLYAAGLTANGSPYLAMELVRGRSLAHILKTEGRVDAKTAGFFCWQALRGLSATHAVGVLHRDLKPGNLVVEPTAQNNQRLVVIDFGFASLEGGAGITQQGFVVGSLSYMAPERLAGSDPVDERSDLYAMGIVLYELIAGRVPFHGDDSQVASGHLDEEVPPLATLVADVPAALDRVLAKAVQKRPGDRYRSAQEMADALKTAFR
jgi:serine/threonine-protein kinase